MKVPAPDTRPAAAPPGPVFDAAAAWLALLVDHVATHVTLKSNYQVSWYPATKIQPRAM